MQNKAKVNMVKIGKINLISDKKMVYENNCNWTFSEDKPNPACLAGA
jgi:hypothetical protein